MSIAAAEQLLTSVWAQLENERRQNIAEAAAREPERYRPSRVLAAGGSTSYVYWSAGRNRKGQLVRFCAARSPNVGGYWLCWKETRMKKQTVRTHWKSFKTEGRAHTECQRMTARARCA